MLGIDSGGGGDHDCERYDWSDTPKAIKSLREINSDEIDFVYLESLSIPGLFGCCARCCCCIRSKLVVDDLGWPETPEAKYSLFVRVRVHIKLR